MSNENNGGPAFPVNSGAAPGQWAQSFPGMTLRDWFAGQALVGITSVLHEGIRPADIDGMARDCYGIADAMLRAREKDTE